MKLEIVQTPMKRYGKQVTEKQHNARVAKQIRHCKMRAEKREK